MVSKKAAPKTVSTTDVIEVRTKPYFAGSTSFDFLELKIKAKPDGCFVYELRSPCTYLESDPYSSRSKAQKEGIFEMKAEIKVRLREWAKRLAELEQL